MRKVFLGKIYDTETATELLRHDWQTHHPNLSGGSPTLDHVRALYRTKKGVLFGYAYDEEGYGRNRNGETGAFVRKYEDFFPFFSEVDVVGDQIANEEAMKWCEEQEVFDARDMEKVFTIEEA